MKRKFTFLSAALVLLVCLTIPTGMWGQTRATETFTYSDYIGQGGPSGTGSEYTMVKTDVSISDTKFYGNTSFVNLYAGGVSTITPASGVTITQIVLTASAANYNGFQSDGTVTPSTGSVSADGTAVTWTGSASSAFTISHNKQIRWTTIVVTYSTGSTSNCAIPTFNPAAGTYTEAQTVTISCATEGATIYYTLDGTDPTTDSEVYSSALTISETTTVKAMAVKADYNNSEVASATYEIVEPVSGYTIDFEQAASLYSDWTFANMESHQTGNSNVSAHSGTYYGTTGGKATASITTKDAIATPYTLTCYVTKQTTNTTTSTWYIQVSEDGEEWTNVASQDATSMTAGTWVEFTATLTAYTNVYVRVYYNGSTAVRNIDDLTLVTTVPSTPYINVTEPDELTYNATSGSIYYEIANYVEGTMGASTEAEWISGFTYDQVDEIGEVGFTTTENTVLYARTATVILTYTYGDNQTVTANVTVSQAGNPNAPGTQNNPYTVAQARAAIDAGEGITNVYATGIVSEIVTAYNSQYGNITYNISADGTTEADQLQAYRGKSYNGENFTSEDDIQVGDIVVVYGSLTKYGETYEFLQNNQLVSLERPVVQTEAIYNYSINGVEGDVIDSYVGETITLAAGEDYNEDFTFAGWTVDPDDIVLLNGSYTLTEEATTFYAVYANSIEGAPIIAYNKVSEISEGQYLIVYETDHVAFNGALETFDAVGNSIGISINNGMIEVDEQTSNAEFTIAALHDGYYSVQGTSGKYVGVSSYSNGLTTYDEPIANYVSFDENDNVLFSITFLGGTMTLKYNKASNQTRFRYYKNGQEDIQLYKKETTTPVTTAYYILISENTLDISGYGSNAGGYYLIASPVAFVTPSASNGFLTSEYDLYYFDQSEDQEWRNYETTHFNLESGKGYLYASSTATQLTFTGQPYNGNGVVALDYDADAALAGWNLVGNPFDDAATCSKAFYRLNSEGSEVNAETETGSIAAMEGVFVVAEGSGETITFTKGGSAKVGEMVVMNVTHNRGNVIDRAIVRFDEGSQLPKFQLFQNSTKLYIPQGDNDFAIVRSAHQGEMPVNFKARENGTYTISVNAENVEMDYLHLIDNKTGMDVDLLQTSSYTFEATTRDYASRFRLVFSANDNNAEGNAHFAYFNGSEWQISNTGEATLQVVDVMGRIVKNVAIEDNATVSINELPGVYMMRLINGNDVKVQKVIIK